LMLLAEQHGDNQTTARLRGRLQRQRKKER